MSAKRALLRVIVLVVFIIPIGWYLFLQFFGENKFNLPVLGRSACDVSGVVVVKMDTAVGREEINQSARLDMRLQRKKFRSRWHGEMSCRIDSVDFALLDSKRQVRGVYTYDRVDIDRLLIELDILLRLENYGDVVRR